LEACKEKPYLYLRLATNRDNNPLTPNIILIILGWALGIISGLIVPEFHQKREEKRKLGLFKKQLRLEINNLKSMIESEVNAIKKYYEIESTKDEDFISALAVKNLHCSEKDISEPIHLEKILIYLYY